ncbi:MAG: AAA family ATPase, partial [Abditibacteriaceae bacterium]
MKFQKIHITGFGALQNLELDDISPGLNIIEGANEAGKTTMLEFVRALFFGFAQRDKTDDDARRYLPNGGGAHGGWAILQNSHNEKIRIERTGGKSSSGVCNVQLLGTDRDINIDALLNGADRTLYEQIFAFSLDELTDFSSSDQRVQNRIYAASSGKQGEFLLDALKRTEEAADKIYLKGGRKPQLNSALAEYRDLESHIKGLSGQVEEYNSDRDQYLNQQQTADELRKQFAIIKKQLDKAKLHNDVWETWVRLSALREELNELPTQAGFDASVAGQMTDLKIKLQQQQEAIDELQPRLKRVKKEIEDYKVNSDVLRNAASIKELKEQLATYESTLRTLPLEEQKRTVTENQIKVLLEQLG